MQRRAGGLDGFVSVEVSPELAHEAEATVAEARDWVKRVDRPNLLIKIPATRAGLTAIEAAIAEGISVNVTLIFSAAQALLAAKVGATFVSPFVGRLDDIATPGMDLITQIVDIFQNFPLSTEVLVASTRGPMHIVEAARLGADVCTCPPKVIDALFNHPLTDIGLERFLADWAKARQPVG